MPMIASAMQSASGSVREKTTPKFGGRLKTKSRKVIEGTHKQYAYNDAWQESIDIEFSGELTPEVQAAITKAFYASKVCTKAQSSWGALRWSSPDHVVGVDVEKRQLIIECSVNLCD